MSGHEYPDGYHVQLLDSRVDFDSLNGHFYDTGSTGVEARAWLSLEHDAINAELAHSEYIREAPSIWEFYDIREGVDAKRGEVISRRLARDFIDRRRAITPDIEQVPYRIHHLKRMPTMARPDIQRLPRSEQKKVLQHEVWTEAERLWLVEQLIAARHDTPSEESQKLREGLDDSLSLLDGMSMHGMEGWSHPIQRMQVQFGVAKGDSDKVAVITTHKNALDIKEDIAHLNSEELQELRDGMVRRIETEIALYRAADGPGSPTDKLYAQVRWIESFLDFRFGIKDAGAEVEAASLAKFNASAASYVARMMHALRQPQNAEFAPVFAQNLDAAIRWSGAAQNVTQLASGHTMDYGDLENYVTALWEVGEQRAEQEAAKEATRIIGRTAHEAAARDKVLVHVR